MPSAPLSHHDLTRLQSVLGTMLAPHEYGDARAWGDALCRELAALVPDGMVGLLRATPQGPFTHTPLPLDDQVLYVRHYARLDLASARQTERRLVIAHRWSLTAPDEMRGSEFQLDDDALRARFGLTAREVVVARLLAERLSDAEIAGRLGTSPHTARTHAERVRTKLGVARRHEVGARLRG